MYNLRVVFFLQVRQRFLFGFPSTFIKIKIIYLSEERKMFRFLEMLSCLVGMPVVEMCTTRTQLTCLFPPIPVLNEFFSPRTLFLEPVSVFHELV